MNLNSSWRLSLNYHSCCQHLLTRLALQVCRTGSHWQLLLFSAFGMCFGRSFHTCSAFSCCLRSPLRLSLCFGNSRRCKRKTQLLRPPIHRLHGPPMEWNLYIETQALDVVAVRSTHLQDGHAPIVIYIQGLEWPTRSFSECRDPWSYRDSFCADDTQPQHLHNVAFSSPTLYGGGRFLGTGHLHDQPFSNNSDSTTLSLSLSLLFSLSLSSFPLYPYMSFSVSPSFSFYRSFSLLRMAATDITLLRSTHVRKTGEEICMLKEWVSERTTVFSRAIFS